MQDAETVLDVLRERGKRGLRRRSLSTASLSPARPAVRAGSSSPGSGRAAVSSASKGPRCTCTTSELSPTSPNRDDHSQRGFSSWRYGDARPSWSADPATTSSTQGDQPPRPWKSLESRDAGKPARPVRAGGRRKRT